MGDRTEYDKGYIQALDDNGILHGEAAEKFLHDMNNPDPNRVHPIPTPKLKEAEKPKRVCELCHDTKEILSLGGPSQPCICQTKLGGTGISSPKKPVCPKCKGSGIKLYRCGPCTECQYFISVWRMCGVDMSYGQLKESHIESTWSCRKSKPIDRRCGCQKEEEINEK